MKRVGLTGLLKLELPAGVLVRLCDGGYTIFGGETYTSQHPTFGTIAELRPLTEGLGDEIPALELALYPHPTATAFDLIQPGYQMSRLRLWIGEFDVDSGVLVGAPDLLFDGQLDQASLTVERGERRVSYSAVSSAERLFTRNTGNTLSDAFHQQVWPGERGHANAAALAVPVAWGAENPPRAAYSSATPAGGMGGTGLSRTMVWR